MNSEVKNTERTVRMSEQHDLRAGVRQAFTIFLETDRKLWDQTVWYTSCTEGSHARVFFQGHRDNKLTRLTVSKIAADAFEQLCAQGKIEVLRPAAVLKLRDRATSLRDVLPSPQHLSGDIDETFRAGLDSLCQWQAPASVPTSGSGDVHLRALTLTLAQKFAEGFAHIPVDYIHSLVMIGWPQRSSSATWRVLPAHITERLKLEAKKRASLAAAAQDHTLLALQAAASKHIMSATERMEVNELQRQIVRLRRGKSRFSTDVERLQAMLDIAESCTDQNLAEELLKVVAYNLQHC